MGNKIPYSEELAARVVELYRRRVCIRVIVELTNCSVAQAKRAIRESPTRNADAAARILVQVNLLNTPPRNNSARTRAGLYCNRGGSI